MRNIFRKTFLGFAPDTADFDVGVLVEYFADATDAMTSAGSNFAPAEASNTGGVIRGKFVSFPGMALLFGETNVCFSWIIPDDDVA